MVEFSPRHLNLYTGLTVACLCAKSLQSCLTFCDPPQTLAHQAPLSMGFSRQQYWSGLPCPSPRDLTDPRIEQMSPALQAYSSPLTNWEAPT